jgi:hypothetical protein
MEFGTRVLEKIYDTRLVKTELKLTSVHNRINNNIKININNKINTAKHLNNLSCFYTNATSLNTEKLAELQSLIHTSKAPPSLVLITETWFNESSIFNLTNYIIYRHDRKNNPHGGVCIYISETLISHEVTHYELNNDSEQVWCSVNLGTEIILVGCIYRPPLSNDLVNNQIISSINFASSLVEKKHYSGLLIAGDFNLDHTTWYCNTATTTNTLSEDFIDTFYSNHLTQHVDFNTFQLNSTIGPSSTLDLILTESPQRIFSLERHSQLGCTKKGRAHLCLTWNFAVESSGSPKNLFSLSREDFKNGNFDKLNLFFKDID